MRSASMVILLYVTGKTRDFLTRASRTT